MINLLKRIWRFLLGKGHTAMDQIEDPIEKANLKITEMKSGQGKLVEAVAKIKAVSIKHGTDAKKFKKESDDYLDKAKKLKARWEAEEENRGELEKYIKVALNKHENLKLEADKFEALKSEQDRKVEALEVKTKTYISSIKEAEAKLKTLKAQSSAAEVNKQISKDLSDFNFDGIGTQLGTIEENIEADNIEAESWMSLGEDLKTDEQKMEELLSSNSPSDDKILFDSFMNLEADVKK